MDGQEALNGGATPPAHCVRLFGVKLTDLSSYQQASTIMRKSVSTGNLGLMGFNALQKHSDCAQVHQELGVAHRRLDSSVLNGAPQQAGYASDGLTQSSSLSLRERKKGVPWTEDEHRLFLAGLHKLGKGDWRGISRNFVTTRTPTQVASHAQKYFLRQGNLNKRRRRSSLFDIINSNMVPGTNVIGDDPQAFGAMELVRPPLLELGLQQVAASSSSLLNSLSAYSKPPSSAIPSVCADLCLGHSHSQQWQESAESVSSVLSQSGKQASVTDVLPASQLLPSKRKLGLDDAMLTDCKSKSICTIASSSSSSKSISSAPSLCRIDEMSELSSLNLSLGPPMPMEASELALKLEQPATSRLSVSPSAMSELKEVLLTAGAGTVAGNANKVSSMANAIRVV